MAGIWSFNVKLRAQLNLLGRSIATDGFAAKHSPGNTTDSLHVENSAGATKLQVDRNAVATSILAAIMSNQMI